MYHKLTHSLILFLKLINRKENNCDQQTKVKSIEGIQSKGEVYIITDSKSSFKMMS